MSSFPLYERGDYRLSFNEISIQLAQFEDAGANMMVAKARNDGFGVAVFGCQQVGTPNNTDAMWPKNLQNNFKGAARLPILFKSGRKGPGNFCLAFRKSLTKIRFYLDSEIEIF